MWTWIIVGICAGLVLLLCFALAVASFSFENFYSKLQETEQIANSYGVNTLDYVSAINKHFFGGKLKIAQCPEFEDNYTSGCVSLSARTMASNSLASLATVSHELGHARQDSEGKLTKHWQLRKEVRICGLFFMPILIAGAVLSLLYVFQILPEIMWLIIGLSCLGVAFAIFLLAVYLRYREVKVEKQASNYAIEFLREILTEKEVKICKEFLDSARLTYWARLIRTLLSWTMLTQKDSMFK